jgi:hypothetical protein
MHVQRATIAGAIAIGTVADLNLQLYVALIIGAVGGLFSTISFAYLTVSIVFLLLFLKAIFFYLTDSWI